MSRFRVSFEIRTPDEAAVNSLQLERWLQFHLGINCNMGPDDVGEYLIDRDLDGYEMDVDLLSVYPR